ncbi:hypothetical protein Fot_31139 [Forsythia ovata]|uniref:DUF674 family protein n=1 Tax=Forsythia ovata TaxID=205694 RepID=A0ABD1T438_9LAMI
MTESTLSLKLLIDPKNKRVLFAEAGKDAVDFIIHILSLPLASVIKLVGQQEMVGCLGNLYKSIDNFNTTYIQQGMNMDIILKQKAPNWTRSMPLVLLDKPDAPIVKNFYRCSYCNGSVADDARATCPSCSRSMNSKLNFVRYPWQSVETVYSEDGFVKGVASYMVTDDLVVKPLTAMLTIDLLNKFNVKELGELQEKEASLAMNEALKLLKASLQYSNKVLTTVFLGDEYECKNMKFTEKVDDDVGTSSISP